MAWMSLLIAKVGWLGQLCQEHYFLFDLETSLIANLKIIVCPNWLLFYFLDEFLDAKVFIAPILVRL